MWTILLLAIVGTLINFGLIGGALNFVNEIGALGTIRGLLPDEEIEITGMQIFLFASLISAVDPVAVLAIFQEVHINNGLYFLVFGESLLNGKLCIQDRPLTKYLMHDISSCVLTKYVQIIQKIKYNGVWGILYVLLNLHIIVTI